jgi:hypothetical protein
MQLINNISFEVLEPIGATINTNTNIIFTVHETTCNHILTFGFEGFVLNLKQVIGSELIETNNDMGLSMNNNKNFTELNISYNE